MLFSEEILNFRPKVIGHSHCIFVVPASTRNYGLDLKKTLCSCLLPSKIGISLLPVKNIKGSNSFFFVLTTAKNCLSLKNI